MAKPHPVTLGRQMHNLFGESDAQGVLGKLDSREASSSDTMRFNSTALNWGNSSFDMFVLLRP